MSCQHYEDILTPVMQGAHELIIWLASALFEIAVDLMFVHVTAEAFRFLVAFSIHNDSTIFDDRSFKTISRLFLSLSIVYNCFDRTNLLIRLIKTDDIASKTKSCQCFRKQAHWHPSVHLRRIGSPQRKSTSSECSSCFSRWRQRRSSSY